MTRCDAEIAALMPYLMTGALSPYVDPSQPDAARIDMEGLLCGITDWMCERALLEAMEG